MKTFHKGGVHPHAEKLTASVPVTTLPAPEEVILPLSQCIGAPSKPLVKPGDVVVAGQMVADAGGFVGAPIHSPVNGVVKKIEKVRNPQGLWQDAIIITVDNEKPQPEFVPRSEEEIAALSPEDIVGIIGNAGIVGLGGATFPTRVKLTPPEGKTPDLIVINGAECEPYLTCDDRLMRSHAEGIVTGTRLIMRSVGVSNAIVGIEENKPEAIESMKKAASAYPEISVVTLKKKYPQGGEKQLIVALTGREVPMGGLPVDVGCIVDNVATAYTVYEAVCLRRPLTQRIVTVTGEGLSAPGNFLVPFGTPIQSLIDAAGGLPEDAGKVIAGGPMMGRAVSDLSAPSTKGLSGIVVLSAKNSQRHLPRPCLRCAKCVDACPMGLEPYLLMLYAEHNRWEDAAARQAMGCIECGCCSFTCPSDRPILDYIKLAKINIRKNGK